MKKNNWQDFRDSFEENFNQQKKDNHFLTSGNSEEKSRPYKKRRIKPVHKKWEH